MKEKFDFECTHESVDAEKALTKIVSGFGNGLDMIVDAFDCHINELETSKGELKNKIFLIVEWDTDFDFDISWVSDRLDGNGVIQDVPGLKFDKKRCEYKFDDLSVDYDKDFMEIVIKFESLLKVARKFQMDIRRKINDVWCDDI